MAGEVPPTKTSTSRGGRAAWRHDHVRCCRESSATPAAGDGTSKDTRRGYCRLLAGGLDTPAGWPCGRLPAGLEAVKRSPMIIAGRCPHRASSTLSDMTDMGWSEICTAIERQLHLGAGDLDDGRPATGDHGAAADHHGLADDPRGVSWPGGSVGHRRLASASPRDRHSDDPPM